MYVTTAKTVKDKPGSFPRLPQMSKERFKFISTATRQMRMIESILVAKKEKLILDPNQIRFVKHLDKELEKVGIYGL